MRRALIIVVVAISGMASSIPAQAANHEFRVITCSQETSQSPFIGTLTSTIASINNTNECPSQKGAIVAKHVLGKNAKHGVSTSWRLHAPSISIKGILFQLSGKESGGWNTRTYLTANGQKSVTTPAKSPGNDESYYAYNAPEGHPGFSDLWLKTQCSRPNVGFCVADGSYTSRFRDLQMKVEDTAPPTVNQFSFPSEIATGTTEVNTTGAVSDLGSGIKRLVLMVVPEAALDKGTTCQTVNVAGQEFASSLAPCPGQESVDIEAIIPALEPGEHNAVLCAVDFADRTSCAVKPFVVSNASPPLPPPVRTRLDVKVTGKGKVIVKVGKRTRTCAKKCSVLRSSAFRVNLKAKPRKGFKLKGWAPKHCRKRTVCQVYVTGTETVKVSFAKSRRARR